MADLGKMIMDGLSDAGKGIGKAASDFGNAAGEVAGNVGEHLNEAKDNVGAFFQQTGQGIAGVVGGIIHHEDEGSKENKELDEYEAAIVEYNQAYTDMSDEGISLYQMRERSNDMLNLIEGLINSIANTPKEFDVVFEGISADKANFKEAESFAKEELDAARRSAMSAGGGIAAGAAVASMAPTAAVWIATTFGTASTGAAISTLSGAAASQAALAWLGGGALAAGGGGVAAGNALLALAGPVGWGIAGATLLTSIILFTRKRFQLQEQKQAELNSIKDNTASVRSMQESLSQLLHKTAELREELLSSYAECMGLYGGDYSQMDESKHLKLGALVNNSKALGSLLTAHIETDSEQ